jgi:hypothetical protein
MSAPLPEVERLAAVDLLVAMELLRFVADLCAGQPEELNVALCRFTSCYYPSTDLAAEALGAADRLARLLGYAGSSPEAP